ncbi:MAG: iron ABC transporter permease [Pseudomonadota bacterium]
MTAQAGTDNFEEKPFQGVPRLLKEIVRPGNALIALAIFLVGLPLFSTVLIGIFAGGGETWNHIIDTFFWTYLTGSLVVLSGVALLILITAVPAAWIVTVYDFPGRQAFSWLLILPLAAPGYVLAYSYADLLGVVGPIQTAIRDATGLAARDYWFPDIRSRWGCAFVLAAALYPYVYLTARAAFTSQSVCTLEAAQALGAAPWRRFTQVALPGARPAIVAGLALALMEAAADYGAADFLGVQTLTVGVFRAWSSFSDPAAGARLALVLVALALTLLWIERRRRGDAGTQASSIRWRTIQRKKLGGWLSLLAVVFCSLIFIWGFAAPFVRLIWLAIEARSSTPPLIKPLLNSIFLAGAGAAAAFIIALIFAIGARSKSRVAQVAKWIAAGGYATPGAVLALGGVYALNLLPFTLTGLAALTVLVLVYVSRFTAAGTGPLEAALGRAPASLNAAARSLGATPIQRVWRVDLPIILPGAAAAGLILFVETLKELPATLMLRPFNLDTLAVRAYAYASDERLETAALPSLVIVLCGLLPVILLSWRLSTGRAGGGVE